MSTIAPYVLVYLFLSVCAVALFSFIAVAAWSGNRRKEREAFYRSETVKKVAELQSAGSTSALDVLREEDRIARRRRQEGQRLGGLVTTGVGIGTIILLKALEKSEPVYLAGLIPLLVGLALLVYSYLLAPKE